MATSIRLSPESEKRLDFLAAQTGRSKAFYLRQMIENGLDDLEDYYLARRRTGARAPRQRKNSLQRGSKTRLGSWRLIHITNTAAHHADRVYRYRQAPTAKTGQAHSPSHC